MQTTTDAKRANEILRFFLPIAKHFVLTHTKLRIDILNHLFTLRIIQFILKKGVLARMILICPTDQNWFIIWLRDIKNVQLNSAVHTSSETLGCLHFFLLDAEYYSPKQNPGVYDSCGCRFKFEIWIRNTPGDRLTKAYDVTI